MKIALAALFFLFSINALAQVDPAIEWKVIETPHFEIIYDKNLRSLAEVYAYEAERSFEDLKPVFQEVTEKTIVTIIDNTDETNGYAQFIPYPHVVVFPVLPNDLSSINYFDNWARDLMIHEYTHILSFQPSHGFYTPLRWIFGTIVRPNAILPRWFLEGIAVQVESRYTKKGRLNSPATMGILRALVDGDALYDNDLAKINESTAPQYPYGHRPYLFGALLWQEILESSEPGVVERLHQKHSRRLPFFLNGPIEDETQKNYDQLLQQKYEKITSTAQRQIQYLNSNKQHLGQRFSKALGASHLTPRISPDGRTLVYISYTPKKGTEIQKVRKPENSSASFSDLDSEALISTSGTNQIDWFSDSKKIVFDKIHRWNNYYYYSDLFIYDFETKKTEPLTKGLRAREPSLSPDNQLVAFVKIEAATTSLAVMNLATQEVSTVFSPRAFNRISSPVWLNNNALGFVGRNKSGDQRFYYLKLSRDKTTALGKPRRLLKQIQHVSQPKKVRNGLLFSSYQSGVSNVYFSPSPYESAWPISNSITHVLNADQDPHTKEVIFSQTTETGPQLHNLKNLTPVTLKKLNLAKNQLKPFAKTSSLAHSDLKYEEEDFWGIEYLRPRYWIPFIFAVEGGAIFQGSTGGNDPLGINSYYLNGSFDTVTEKASYGAGYFNGSTPITFGLEFAEFQDYLPGTGATLTNQFGLASAQFYLPALSYRWRGLLGYSYDMTQTTTTELKGMGPTVGINYIGSKEDINEDDDLLGNSYASLSHTQYLESGDFYSFGRTRLQISQSLQLFLPTQHSFNYSLKASYAPEMPYNYSVVLGDKTVGGNYLVNIINSNYIMRGYPTGNFAGRTLVNANLEYRFPIADIYKGKKLFPLFLNNLSGALFVDGVAVDGAFLNAETEIYTASKLDDQYWSAGLELHLNSTVAYHLPVTFSIGLYYGFDAEAGGGFTPFVSLGYSGHDGASQNTRNKNSTGFPSRSL